MLERGEAVSRENKRGGGCNSFRARLLFYKADILFLRQKVHVIQ